MDAGGALGEVAVDVYADLSRLDADFNQARQKTERVSKDMQAKMDKANKAAAASTSELDRAVAGLARSYSPLHAAQLKYAKDLETIDRLQKANVFSANDAAMFTEKATAAYKKMGDEQSRVHQWGLKAGEAIRRGAEIAAVAVTAAAVLAVKSSLDQAKAIKSTSEELRISTTAWQEWLFIASQSGVSAGQLETGFTNLEKVMGRAGTGAKRESALFAALGISLTDASGKAKDAAAIMPELADKLNRVGDANQKAAALQILFGESANEMGKLLEGGSSKIDQLAEAAHNLGIVLSADQIQRADETAQKLEDVKNVLAANIAGVVADNAGAIVGLAGALGQLTSAIIGFLGSNPQAALAIIGAIAGSKFGVAGAVVGAAGGAIAGGRVAQAKSDQDMTYGTRMARVENLEKRQRALEKRGVIGRALTNSSQEYAAIKERLPVERRLLQQSFQAGIAAGIKAAPAKPTGPNINLGNLNAPKPRGGGGSGRKAPKEKIDRTDDELLALQEQILRIASGNASNAAARADIELQLLDIDKQQFQRKLEANVHNGRMTDATAQLVMAKYDELDQAKRNEIEAKKQEQLLKESTDLTVNNLGREAEMLEATKELTRSTAKRRDLEFELFEISQKIQKAKLDEVIASIESSDAQIEEARLQKEFLDKIRPLREEALRRANMTAVERFHDSIPDTQEEVDEAMDRHLAAKLEDQRNRSVQFADDIADAFANMTQSLLEGDPVGAIKNFVNSLARTFQEEVIVRPIRDLARKMIGGPLAESVVGAPAGPEGLSMQQLAMAEEQLKTSTVGTATAMQGQLIPAIQQAAVALQSLGTGAPGGSFGGLFDGGMVGGDELAVGTEDMGPISGSSASMFDQAFMDFSTTTMDATQALSAATLEVGNFGNALPGVLQSITSMATGGGGGGGLLGTILKVAGTVAGGVSGGGGGGAFTGHSLGGGGFKDGGYLGGFAGGGRLLRGPGSGRSDSITAVGPKGSWAKFSSGEFINDADSTSKFLPLLEGINSGRIANMGELAGIFGAKQPSQSIDRSTRISFGNIVLPNATDERTARRGAKIASAEIQRNITKAMKSGVLRRD